MNCISARRIDRRRGRTRFHPSAPGLLLLAFTLQGPAASETAESLHYAALYTVTPVPAEGRVDVQFEVRQQDALLRELRFEPGPRVSAIRATRGELESRDGQLTWHVPRSGGTLTWQVAVPHRRNGAGYDAWLGADWGLFRAEDIIPRAATTTLRGAVSRTEMQFRLPRRWSVETQYFDDDGIFRITKPERRFDQPSGWIVMGRIGVRRETIAGIRVAVAGPVGHSVRRMDILALLNWTLPELARLLPELPERLTVVSAGDPMWRGGLSAPRSIYLHADRPLISENATSTLLHEIMHLALGLDSAAGGDWIIEGLAEYYSLELLRRSGSITRDRYLAAREDLARWAEEAKVLCTDSASGATTALAVVVLAALDAELRRATSGKATLDNVTRALRQAGDDVDLARLSAAASAITGAKPDALHGKQLPGCRTMAADD
ncbi:MAG: hypothetical protein R3176_06475 [Woeseiaceae bacterium]|nr:hypothetical protein [Woeseiaceae bacterium]